MLRRRCDPPRANAHIRFLFSGLVDEFHLALFGRLPDSIISAPRVQPVTPPSAATARLDRTPLPPTESNAGTETNAGLRAAPARADRPFRGIALILVSTVFLGISDVTSKYLSATLPSIEIAWIRFLVFALIMVPAMLPGSPLYALRSERRGLQLLRGVTLLASSLIFISGLRLLPIAEASATSFVAPLFVTALSIVFLGESVGLRRWLATAVGLIGVLIILRPGSSAFHPAVFFPIVSALAWACTLIMTRMISGRERAVTTMAYSSIVGVCILSALVPSVWVAPSWHDIAFGILIGLASTAGQWIVVLAFRYADASVLAPFSYTQLLWVSILGFVIFGELPDLWTVTGAAFIVVSGLYTAHRERIRRSQLLAIPAEPSPNA
jgi:drug/metabolite transporter (DMT)-like permease